MGKIRRGNYIFRFWKGDHGNHVHIMKDQKLIAKWDLDEEEVIEGHISKRLRRILKQLKKERFL